MANASSYFALEARDMWHCVPHHPLWISEGVILASIILSYYIQYMVVGLRVSNVVFADALTEEWGKLVTYKEGETVPLRMLLTLSETWSTPEAKFLMSLAMFVVVLNASVCFVHPHVTALVIVSACLTVTVAVTKWSSMQHRVASIFLAIFNSVLQIVINVYVLQYQIPNHWLLLLALQVAFLAVFILFVLLAWHFKAVNDAPIASSPLEHAFMPDEPVACWERVLHWERHVDAEVVIYSVFLPYAELANLAVQAVTLFLVRNPNV